ncbi:MAG: four-carbon acid sugar kinase family protein, partial [Candidatus Eremiobacteraeota bacterium]|nr:four-carbon acid sugar kinase family protein [Candidatus Eremiobacteraeota bacterium]
MQISFYGDDFTGATDALAQYARFGLRGRLFFKVPAEDDVATLDEDVIGVAGIARSLETQKMDREVLPFLRSHLRAARVVQYKICSTFDSSPTVGSIGHAIDLARRERFPTPYPVLPAQPHFGRYTLFANHFAAVGVGAAVERLDRHPTMSRHPSTPMNEADLRRVLTTQGVHSAPSFDITQLRAADAADRLRRVIDEDPRAIVFDALEDDDLKKIGELILDLWPREIFAVGSGGLSFAIGNRLGSGRPEEETIDEIERLFVVSGSLAQRTGDQIEWAVANGWGELTVDPRAIDMRDEAVVDELAERALAIHRSSRRGCIVASAHGPRAAGGNPVSAAELGTLFGALVLRAFRSGETRAVLCGGDTSSYAARATGARALSIARFIDIAAALCRLSAEDPQVDGKHVLLKGGQVGDLRLFEMVRRGAGKTLTARTS